MTIEELVVEATRRIRAEAERLLAQDVLEDPRELVAVACEHEATRLAA